MDTNRYEYMQMDTTNNNRHKQIQIDFNNCK